MNSLVFTCTHLYSLVFICIHLYSLEFTCIQLNSFLFILIGLIGFYDSLTHQKVSQTCSHTKKNVKTKVKLPPKSITEIFVNFPWFWLFSQSRTYLRTVKSMEKFISVHYLKSGENQSSIWHSGESQCNFKSWPILRRCNASEQVSKN